MYRSVSSALAAVLFVGALTAAAPAASVSNDSQAMPQDIAAPVVSTQAAAELKTIATLSQMPSANADLQMWSETAPASRSASETRALASARRHAGPLHRFASGFMSSTSSIAMSLTHDAMRFIGTPYVFGGTSPGGFDCSGYVQHVFAMLGIALPRTADAQYYASASTHGNLVLGDLVFFQTYLPGPSHVGIYLGGGRFIHSSSHGVMVSRLRDSYWSSRYLGSKRVARLASR